MKYETDKEEHGLIKIYNEILKFDKPITLLEVGIYKGGSLQYYGELLPTSTIIGVDIINPVLPLPKNVTFYNANQLQPESFVDVIKHAPFDVIIDDGSHQRLETETTIKTLWEHLKSGGMYIIEDWGVGYWNQEQYQGMKELILDIIKNKNEIISFRVEDFPSHSICILWKK
jgi:cephalosporin hydroxylase